MLINLFCPSRYSNDNGEMCMSCGRPSDNNALCSNDCMEEFNGREHNQPTNGE